MRDDIGYRVGLFIAMIIALVTLTLWSAAPVQPQQLDRWANTDPARREWFRGLRQPHTQAPCCDLGDSVKTRFRVDRNNSADQWWFLDPDDKVWKAIPPDIVLDQQSIDGEAYLFRSPASKQLYCFVKPRGGM